MANFYLDNDDIKFLFKHIDMNQVTSLQEEGFKFSKDFDYAPTDTVEAVKNYEMVLESLGELSADFVAPRAEDVDRQGKIRLSKAEALGWRLGMQSYSFKNYTFAEAVEKNAAMGMKTIEVFSKQKLSPTDDATTHFSASPLNLETDEPAQPAWREESARITGEQFVDSAPGRAARPHPST